MVSDGLKRRVVVFTNDCFFTILALIALKAVVLMAVILPSRGHLAVYADIFGCLVICLTGKVLLESSG